MDVFNSQFYDSSISSDSSQTATANSATSTNPPRFACRPADPARGRGSGAFRNGGLAGAA